MPIFEYYLEGRYIRKDITVNEFISECDLREIKEIIHHIFGNKEMSIGEQLFEECLMSLHNKWNQLSSDEEEQIMEIGKKFK